MKKTVVIILKAIRYSGDSIGNDIQIDGEVFGKKFSVSEKIKRGAVADINLEIGRTETDKPSLTVLLTFQVTEQDLLFPDVGKKADTMIVDLNRVQAQRMTIVVEVREKKIRTGKRKAFFEIICEARIEKDSPVSLANNSVAWWERWKKLQLYSYRGVTGKEDYNRYDAIIKNVVAKWNKEFCDDLFPPNEPLDPNLVKAIIFQESRVGYDPNAPINIMQVGNPGDPSLKTLRGELKEYWFFHGKILQLKYKNARVTTVEESITWGTRWLYHKAQENIGETRRVWRSWQEAVQKYGPPREEYSEDVWRIYTKGIKKEKKRTIKLWMAGMLMIVAGAIFVFQTAQASLVNAVTHTLSPTERLFIDSIEAGYDSDHSFFWSIVSREKDWWEDLRVGKKSGKHIQWLKFDAQPTEQSILKVRFVMLEGFDRPILEVYGQTHVGNGALYLYEVHDTALKLLLEVPAAVDVHNESAARPEHQERYGYFHCGEVIDGGMLTSDYGDINGDGVDDLTLTGMSNVVCDELIGFDELGYAQTKNVIVERKKVKTYFVWNEPQRRYISR